MKFGYHSLCSACTPGPTGAERTPWAAYCPVSAVGSTSPCLCRGPRGVAPSGSAHHASSLQTGENAIRKSNGRQKVLKQTWFWLLTLVRGSNGPVHALCCLSVLGECSSLLTLAAPGWLSCCLSPHAVHPAVPQLPWEGDTQPLTAGTDGHDGAGVWCTLDWFGVHAALCEAREEHPRGDNWCPRIAWTSPNL